MNKLQKIISLVPSQTELLYDLGLDEEVIGITKFCVHPSTWFKTKTRVGGTKTINIEKIISLKPDLIIANKEENIKEQIEALEKFTKVYVSDVSNLDDAKNMIIEIGSLVNKEAKAKLLVEEIDEKFLQLDAINQNKKPAAYFIWRNPYMAAGGDTFIHDMMERCGFKNIFEDQFRYPEINIKQLKKLNCKLLLLSSEPFPFKQKHIDELQPLLPSTKILLVDGEMFSWYGSRLLLAANYFLHLKQKTHSIV
jgi:ABC-type Fe3+-hydroxamate transport system substrate-binding protein